MRTNLARQSDPKIPVEIDYGDVFLADVPTRGHGCNCAGVMGNGIAVKFRRRCPAMFQEYRKRYRAGTFWVGDVFTWPTPRRTIFNLAPQSVPGPHQRSAKSEPPRCE